MNMNLNAKQIISIIGAVLSVLMVSTAQLTDLFGPLVAKSVVSVAGLCVLIIQSVMTALTSNANVVFDAKSQTGVEVFVDRNASPQIAKLAIDPKQQGISPAAGETAAVTEKAQAA